MFYHIPFSGLDFVVEVFRRRFIRMLMNRGLLMEYLAENLFS